nr:MAG TPA: hypothetical protein [Caudoviricetes sp.]
MASLLSLFSFLFPGRRFVLRPLPRAYIREICRTHDAAQRSGPRGRTSHAAQDSPHLSTMCPRGDICRCGGIGRRYK